MVRSLLDASLSIDVVDALRLHPGSGQRLECSGLVALADANAYAAVGAEMAGDRNQLAWNRRSLQEFFRPQGVAGRVDQDHNVHVAHRFATTSRRTAAKAVSISSGVFRAPSAKRTVPAGNVPIVLWAAGAQWSPTRHMISSSSSRHSPTSAESFS